MKKILPLLAIISCTTTEFKVRDQIQKDQRDLYISKSFMLKEELYHGADFSLSNTDKDFWLNFGFYHGTPSGVDYSEILFARATYTPLTYCAWRCDSKVSRLEGEVRGGGGVTLDLTKKTKRLQIEQDGLAKDIINPLNITTPELELSADMVALIEATLRFGYIEARYSFLFNDEGISHVFNVGARF